MSMSRRQEKKSDSPVVRSEPAEPILDYGPFRGYRVPVAVARDLCEREGLPRPRRLTRIMRGEVNASFRLDFDDADPLILKVWVRTSDPERMRHAESVARQLRQLTGVPTPAWIYQSPADDLIDYPYALQELAGGEDADEAWLGFSRRTKDAFMEDCGLVLREMHESCIDVPGPVDAQAWADEDLTRFAHAVEQLNDQAWMPRAMLDQAVRLWEGNSSLLQEAGGLSFVHYDFQPHNLRVEPVSGRIVSVLDLDSSTRGPAFSDIRDLLLTVFVPDPGSAEPFWRAYGPVDEQRRMVLRLHSLARVLDVLWAYAGPAPQGWNHTTVATLLKDIETA